MVIRSLEPWPKTKRSTVEESRKPHELGLSFEAIQLTRHQILQHGKPTRRKSVKKTLSHQSWERARPTPSNALISQLNVYWCGSRGEGEGGAKPYTRWSAPRSNPYPFVYHFGRKDTPFVYLKKSLKITKWQIFLLFHVPQLVEFLSIFISKAW